ncbi:putative pectinesterase A [Penicillium rolfsii]|nr:putative pectinesterase A [Penicillium rolfsii]
MRTWWILCLTSLAAAAIDASGTCSSTVYITRTTDGSSITSAPAVTVAPDGRGQFTEIGDAVSYAQGKKIPTVTVLGGTYPAITIENTPSVTIVGETVNRFDYTQNKVVVSSDSSALTISANLEGLTVSNINFVNTGPSGSAVDLRGTNLGFYQCQFVSRGESGINAHQALAVIANSYIEAPTDLVEGSPNVYIFNTVIVPTGSFAVIVYTEGPPSGGKSTVVIDRSRVIQKSGINNNNVYLAAASGPGAVVVYRDSALGGLIAPSGVKIDKNTQNDANFNGEYENTGAGAYRNNEDESVY